MFADQFECENGFESQIVVRELGRKFVFHQKLEENYFHRNHCVAVADTVPAAGGEGNVAAWMTLGDVLRQEVVGVEQIRFLAPDVSLTVQRVNVENESRAFGNHETLVDLKVLHRLAENHRANWRNPQGLLNDAFHVLKFSERLGCDFVVRAEHFADFLEQLVLDVLMLSQK